MANNNSQKKITNQMEWLIDVYGYPQKKSFPKDVEKIKLSKLVSKLGFVYEKFRNAIDYHEEHLVRRSSIERFLRRQLLFLQEKRSKKISKDLIYEFIRAKYLPNNILPETLIDELAITIDKYLYIIKYLNDRRLPNYKKLIDWAVEIASNEIDEQLISNSEDKAMINFMYSKMIDDLAFTNTKLDAKERNLQVYLAVMRTFAKADPVTLRYRLLELYFPNWTKKDQADVYAFCKNINSVVNKIDGHLKHKLGFQLNRVVRTQSVFFKILREVLVDNRKDLHTIFHNNDLTEEKIEEVCLINYHHIRKRLVGSIARVIVYILLTKTILALILELPYDYFIVNHINTTALAINIGFHPLLMLLVAITIRVPSHHNTKIIVNELQKIIYGRERKVVFKPKGILKRGTVSYFVFNTIYLIMFTISFGLIIWVLRMLDFNILSGVLFVFFLTAVSFFGFRLRALAKELSVIPRKDNLINFLADFFSLPIIRVGKFLSYNFSKVNIFLYILDFIIETPFKLLVEFFERTVSFVKDKREEIIDE